MGGIRRTVGRIPVAVIVLALTATACADGTDAPAEGSPAADGGDTDPADGGAPTALTVAAPAPVPGGFPAYWLAEGLGFYEEEGLDVTLESPDTMIAPLETGRLDLAGVSFSDTIPPLAEGQEHSVKAFMVTDLFPFLAVTFEDSGVESLEDLRGARIGINEPHDDTDARFLLASGGLGPDEYELIPVGQDTAALLAMESGNIDAFVAAFRQSSTSLQDIASKPIRLLAGELSDGGYYLSGPSASEQFLEENRDVAVRFGRAIAKAIFWQYENPGLAAEVLLEVAPESAESVEQMTEYLEVTNDWHGPVYDEMFEIDESRLQTYLDTWSDLGLIDEGAVEPSQLFTDDLIEEIMDFDVQAVRSEAAAATVSPAG